jgi:hypothetical protein
LELGLLVDPAAEVVVFAASLPSDVAALPVALFVPDGVLPVALFVPDDLLSVALFVPDDVDDAPDEAVLL